MVILRAKVLEHLVVARIIKSVNMYNSSRSIESSAGMMNMENKSNLRKYVVVTIFSAY